MIFNLPSNLGDFVDVITFLLWLQDESIDPSITGMHEFLLLDPKVNWWFGKRTSIASLILWSHLLRKLYRHWNSQPLISSTGLTISYILLFKNFCILSHIAYIISTICECIIKLTRTRSKRFGENVFHPVKAHFLFSLSIIHCLHNHNRNYEKNSHFCFDDFQLKLSFYPNDFQTPYLFVFIQQNLFFANKRFDKPGRSVEGKWSDNGQCGTVGDGLWVEVRFLSSFFKNDERWSVLTLFWTMFSKEPNLIKLKQ